MKKKILISILLLVCFWHFNVKAEELITDVPEVVAGEVTEQQEEQVEEKEKDVLDVSSDESSPNIENSANVFLEENLENDVPEILEDEEKIEEKNIDVENNENPALTIEEENEVETDDELVEVDNNKIDDEASETVEGNYNVTFVNGDYRLSITGGSNILLSELLANQGINISLSEIEEIRFTNDEVLRADRLDNNDYNIESIKSFITTERLIIKLKDGNEINIKVIDPEGPDHLKDINDNEDGTYQLSLDVTGDSETKVETAANVNVLIVYDVSSSMTSNNVTTNPNRNRADYAEDVVHDFVDGLRKYQNASDPSNIQVAVVTFGPTATGRQTWTSDLTNGVNRFFDDGVDGTVTSSHDYNRNNGTNWEHALQQAQAYLRTADSDPTFVILVTDGAPTANGTNGSNPGNPSQMNYSQFYTRYGFATDEARAIQTRDNTTLFGIYAYGREADLLDDLIYYSNTGTERPGMSSATDATENYYNASDTAALTSAIESIFGKIVDALGVGSVTITDGTTTTVVSENTISHLLCVDENSFEYWLTVPVTNNQFTRTDLVSGADVTYTVTDNGDDTLTITWGSNSITVDGSLSLNSFKYKWTEANALYNVAPPAAKFENDAVKWDLTDVGTLLNEVTYTVTFNVWPSQETLDLIADFKNDPSKYDSLDAEIKQYLVRGGEEGAYTYTLLTNTTTSLTYEDTRPDHESGSTIYNTIDPVSTMATQMLTITKKWDNDIDGRTKREIKIDVLKDGESWNTLTLNDSNNYEVSTNIAIGIITDDDIAADRTVTPKASGHDFSFGELGNEAHNWELKSEVVRPMLINGVLTILIRYGTEAPEDGTYYIIDGYYYIEGELDEGVAKLIATNERRSWVDLEKTLDYDETAAHFDDTVFTFDITVGEAGGEDVWFSVIDKTTKEIIKLTDDLGLTVTGATEEVDDETGEVTGYFYATSGSTFTVGIKTGWNLRLLNLLTGTTYTITETNIDSKFEFEKINYLDTKYIDEDGNEVPYEPTITDASIEGQIMSTNVAYGYEFVNKNVNTEITVTKIWDDEDDKYSNRPSDIVLKLTDGTTVAVQPTKTDNGDGTWTYVYTGLRVYDESGELITYTLTEDQVTGYLEAVIDGNQKDGFTVTNTLETISITVNKDWQDNNDQDGIRPTTITLKLSNGDSIELTKEGNWTKTIDNLPKYVNGEEFSYTVTEENVPKDYKVSYSEDGLTAINTHTPATDDVVVTKVWEDNSNKEGLRPSTITVHLYANGTEVDATPEIVKNNNDTWTITYSDLDVNANGEKITYTVTEDEVDKYTTEIEGLTITNSREVEYVEIKVEKVWDDSDNEEGFRPDKVIVNLLCGEEEIDTIELNENNNWKYSWDRLNKYVDGKEVTYSITEDEVDKYESKVEYDDTRDLYVIINSREKEYVEITVKKIWEDDNDRDGVRPKKVIITIKKSASEDESDEVQEVTLDASNSWTETIKLLKYEQGKEVVYMAVEKDVPKDYEVSYSEDTFTITNTHEIKTRDITVTKVWSDDENESGKRPESVTIILLADGKECDKIELSETNNWTHTFEGVTFYDENHKEITYSVSEENVPEGYEVSYEGSAEEGFTVHNVLGQGGDEPPENPQTGDNIVLYLITLLISIIGLVGGKLYIKEN